MMRRGEQYLPGPTYRATQIAHQLRCLRKEIDPMQFGEITEAVPWDILAKDCEQNLDADQVGLPVYFGPLFAPVRQRKARRCDMVT